MREMITATVTLCASLLLAPLLIACQGGQILPGNSLFAPGKPGKMTVAVKDMKDMGRNGDTELAHVTPAEKRMLKEKGGSGTTNPKTGLKEFFGGEGGGGSIGGGGGSRGSAGGGNRSDMERERGRQTGTRGRSRESQRDGRRSRSRINATNVNFDVFGDERRRGRSWADGLDDGGVTIERRKKATFKDESTDADQRDGAIRLDVNVQVSDGGELGDGSSTKPGKTSKDEDRRAGRAAAILGSGAGSEGIRDKLGRSGRRGPGKSLG